jgi:hypothetical protein
MLASIPATSATSSNTFHGFTERQLRIAFLRASIIKNEIAATAIGLKAGLIDPDNAIAHLHEIGASGLLVWESSR